MIATSRLCAILGVSRSWVNRHLRHLGAREKTAGATIFYDEDDIITYINRNAKFDRQTEFLRWLDYMDEDQYSQMQREIFELATNPDDTLNMPVLHRETTQRATAVFGRPLMPAYSGDERIRGMFPWYSAPAGTCIRSLSELLSIKQLQQPLGVSPEMVYRSIFLGGHIRCTLHGRTWFLLQDIPKDEAELFCSSSARTDAE